MGEPAFTVKTTTSLFIPENNSADLAVASTGEGLTQTASGFEVDFSNEDDPAYSLIGRGTINLLVEVWRFLEMPSTKDQAKRALLTISLCRALLEYIEQGKRCEAGEAYFATAVIGCSLLETLLMLACLKERDAVTLSRAWKKFAKSRKGGRFADLLPHIELQHLINIGDELKWFDVTLPNLATLSATDEDRANFAEVEGVSPREAVGRLQSFRNSIHPGRLVREKQALNERRCRTHAMLVAVSCAGVLAYAQGPKLMKINLPVHPALRKLIFEEEDAHLRAVGAGIALGAAIAILPDENESPSNDCAPAHATRSPA